MPVTNEEATNPHRQFSSFIKVIANITTSYDVFIE